MVIMMKINVKKFLTVKKITSKYELEPSLIYYWVRNKKFSYYKFEKKILIEEQDFLNFIELNKIEISEVTNETK